MLSAKYQFCVLSMFRENVQTNKQTDKQTNKQEKNNIVTRELVTVIINSS